VKLLNFLLITGFLILSGRSVGQEKFSLPGADPQLEINYNQGKVYGEIELSSFYYTEIPTDSGDFLKIEIPGMVSEGRMGSPDLPVVSRLVQMDASAGFTFEFNRLDSVVIDLGEEFPDLKVLPFMPSERKGSSIAQNISSENVASEIALDNTSFSLLTVKEQGRMRGVDIAQLQLCPLRLDTKKNTLTVYWQISFNLIPALPVSEAAVDIVEGSYARAFSAVLQPADLGAKKRLVAEQPISMVILSDTLFREALRPLIAWKKRKGFHILEVYSSDPGVGSTSSSIQAYLNELYHHPPEGIAPPSYLLIAGDVEHIPPSSTVGQPTDLYYTTYDGAGDYLPEVFCGRISVKNDSQLTNVIDKILEYEQFLLPEPDFLDRSILIAGYDSYYAYVHGNGQIRYANNNYFNEENGIQASVYLHPAASSQDQEILMDIGSGAAFVNYTGHGEYYGWIDPAFRLGNIDTLGNIHKYSLFVGNGCSTNQYNMSSRDCFAEAILKVKNRGAIGYIGCTNDSYWDEDYYWAVGVGTITSNPLYEESSAGYYDKVFHTGNEPVADWAPSLGEMIFAGNMTVQQSTSTRKKYYWEIYQLMGDPSLVPWFSVPVNEDVSFPPYIPVGTTHISIEASPFDYVALSVDGELLIAGHADAYGIASLELPADESEDDLELVVTGDHRIPFYDTIIRQVARRGFLELIQGDIADESVSNDGVLSESEEFSLNLDVINRGSYPLSNCRLNLTVNEPWVEVIDSFIVVDQFAVGDTVRLRNAFRLKTGSVVADGSAFTIIIEREHSTIENRMILKKKVHSAVMISNGITWDDRPFGNGNGRIEPDEVLFIQWNLSNTGSYKSDSIFLPVQSQEDSALTILEAYTDRPLAAGESGKYSFTASAQISRRYFVSILELQVGNGILVDSIFLASQRYFDDFSTRDLDRFNWIGSSIPFYNDTLNFYCGPASVRTGNIGHNGQTSLRLELETGSADTISFDYLVSTESGYDFFSFYIDSVRRGNWSGIFDWKRAMYVLDSGRHVLEWRYTKDANTVSGKDAAWIDNIVFPRDIVDSLDLALLDILEPGSSVDLGEAEAVKYRIANLGTDSIKGFTVRLYIDTLVLEMSLQDTLIPGQESVVEFIEKLDLSVVRTYPFRAEIDVVGESYPGNNVLRRDIAHTLMLDAAIDFSKLDSVPGKYFDVIVELTNMGNTLLSSWEYEIYIDDRFVAAEGIATGLPPGESALVPVRIIDNAVKTASDGMHEFRILSAPDEELSNNTIEGSVFWGTTGSDIRLFPEIQLYPNPVSSYLHIDLAPGSELPLILEIWAIDGKRMLMIQLEGIENELSVRESGIEDGIYIYRIRSFSGNNVQTGKLIFSRR